MVRKNKNSDAKTSFPRQNSVFTGIVGWLARPGAFLQRLWGKFSCTSRVFKLAVIYGLTVATVTGLFAWRVHSLRLQFPYGSVDKPPPDRPEYLWEEDREGVQPQDPVGEAGDEEAEMVHALQPPIEVADAGKAPDASIINSPALWPVEGELRHFFWDPVSTPLVPPNSQYRYSRGVSIQTESGFVVRAIWGGVVHRVSDIDYPYGASVTVGHAGGLVSYYGALRNVQVSDGESVRQGQVLGRVAPGDGGEPAQLYLEIRDHQTAIDPLLYLSGK